MDPGDHIQQLLKNTGWSCDDLLKKLHQYKTSSHPSKSTQPSSRTKINELSNEEVGESDLKTCDLEELCANSNKDNLQSVSQPVKATNVSTKVNDTFSDTDDEESEVIATNNHIINEIIEDIFQTDPEKSSERDTEKYVLDDINSSEVTEVRVIEVNEEDTNKDQVQDDAIVKPEEIQFLQTYSRSSDCETITIETESSEKTIEPPAKKIEYVEVHPRKQYKIIQGRKVLTSSMLQEKKLSSNFKLLAGTPSLQTDNPKYRRSLLPKISIPRPKLVVKNNIKSIDDDQFQIVKGVHKPCEVGPIVVSPTSITNVSEEDEPNTYVSSITKETNDIDDILPKTYITSTTSNRFYKNTVIICSDSKTNKNMECVLPKILITSEALTPLSTKLTADLKTYSHAISKPKPNNSIQDVLKSDTHQATSQLNKVPSAYATLLKLGNGSRIIKGDTLKKIPVSIKVLASEPNSRSVIEKSPVCTSLPVTSTVVRPNSPILLSQPIDNVNMQLKTGKEEEKSPRDPLASDLLGDQSSTLPRSEDSEDEIVKEEHINMEELEDIRNNLKLQLSSLRTKKRSQFLETTSTKVIDNIECSKKLSLQTTSNKKSSVTKAREEKVVCEEPREEFYTQTNELGLVILNVQGGVELDDLDHLDSKPKNIDNFGKCNDQPQINDKIENKCKEKYTVATNSNSSDYEFDEESARIDDTEQIGVFDQIRKIINKQRDPLKLNRSSSGDSLSVKKVTPKGDDDKKMDISMSCENSQSSFAVESSKVVEKSPFVSNSLDEFLTADSTLNISYQVPQLEASEGINRKLAEDSPLILKKIEDIKENVGIKPKSVSLVKAKTVAQKRKLLERERRKALRKQEKRELKELKLKVKTVHAVIQEIKSAANKENKVGHKHRRDSSYILYNDNKIWVNSANSNKCIAKINCTKARTQKLPWQRKKFSLWHQMRMKDCKVRYRSGPLCKKQDLQITGTEKWETHMLKLPKIFLEVSPKLEQPFCDDIRHRMSSIISGELDMDKIEFALSAVKSKTQKEDEESKPITFPLEYRNKVEYALVRRQRRVSVNTKIEGIPTKPTPQVKCLTDTVADVIEDLIRYVEIKELAPTLIKEDDTHIKSEDEVDVKLLSPIKDNVSVFKKPPRKRSKIENELLRLSCKVVKVEVENNEEQEICTKPYCQLGCVCKSLQCDYILTRHCEKISCIFDCICPQQRPIKYDKVSFTPGTNLLSEDTVTRIEDEAKRNLAKVEREFTQTVIHTNNETIVVGVGDRSKSKRAAKAPAKFSDFVSSSEAICEEDVYSKSCIISLPKLNLSGIIPYCLTHNQYSCHCRGLEVTKSPVEQSKLRKNYEYVPGVNKDTNVSLVHKAKKLKADMKSKKRIKMTLKRVGIPTSTSTDNTYVESENSSLDDNWSKDSSSNVDELSKRPTRNIKKRTFSDDFVEYCVDNYKSDCARVRPILKKYYRVLKYSSSVFQDDFVYRVTDSDVFRLNLQLQNADKPISEADALQRNIIKDSIWNKVQQNKKKKRKQVLESRIDDSTVAKSFNQDSALQRRKKVPLHTRTSIQIKPVFDGEIIINEKNMDLLKKMGPKTVADGYARLLPWTALIKNFQQKTIHIWSMIDQPSRLLINKADKKCPKNYININHSTQMTEVITWIKKNKLPSHYHEESLSFILKETKDNFEICGICTKNILPDQTNKFNPDQDDSDNSDTDRGEIFYHKDLNGVERSFVINKKKIPLVELAEDLPEYKQSTIPQLRVAVPSIFNICRWRMIFLNSDFTFLFFKIIQYSIRYTDLLAIGDYAKKHKCTVWLKNKQMKQEYEHNLFGVYFDPHFTDRIFIGPYFKQSATNDVETLRYINQSLVSSESFHLMRGQGDYKCGHWLVEVAEPSSHTTEADPEPSEVKSIVDSLDSTIDLTSDNDDEFVVQSTVCELSKHPSDKQEYYPFAPVIIHNKQEVKIIDAPPRKPEEFNRYIITNIPHFGYLGAFMHSNREIDVSWPFENKLLRFCSEHAATSFLQERFSSLLQGVPETFKINIIVAHKIDLKVYKPIDSGVLSGHFICGEFGYLNILQISPEQCMDTIGVPKEEIMKLFTKRIHLFVKKKIETLAALLKIPKNNAGGYDVPTVLTKAADEVHAQMKKDQANILLKNKLFLKKRENALKLHKLISELPVDRRNIENLKFRAVLHKPEPIVINDSDEESNKHDSAIKAKASCNNTATVSPKNTGTIEMFRQPPQLIRPKLKSVLKPLVTIPVDKDTSLLIRAEPKSSSTDNVSGTSSSDSVDKPDKPRYIKGVRLIKNSKGKFILVNTNGDKSENISSRTELVIRDSKIFSINSLDKPTASNIPISDLARTDVDETIIIDVDKDNENQDTITEVTLTGNDSVETNENIKEDEDTTADVIHVENEPMIIDLDEISSDDDLEQNNKNS